MKICFIAPAGNYHIKKWCKWFIGQGHEVHVISFHEAEIDGAAVYSLDSNVDVHGNDIGKIKYLTYGKKIKRIVEDIAPDIVNVHYASSYGAAAALSGLKGYILSLWGSDVYDFPNKSILHKAMLKYSLSHAAHIFSTSKAMAEEAGKYTRKEIKITPFGVDMRMFTPCKRLRAANDGQFIIGTVKSLAPKYGIDCLLKAVAIVRKNNPDMRLQLRIAGTGTHSDVYKNLAKELKIDDITIWLGFITQEEAAKEWANMDIGVIPSAYESESFGVSAVEAQASGIPVIISDIPGLMEATAPGKTSIVIPRGDEKALAEAIIRLYENPSMRAEIGEAGRQFVKEKYELNYCFRCIERLFESYM